MKVFCSKVFPTVQASAFSAAIYILHMPILENFTHDNLDDSPSVKFLYTPQKLYG